MTFEYLLEVIKYTQRPVRLCIYIDYIDKCVDYVYSWANYTLNSSLT